MKCAEEKRYFTFQIHFQNRCLFNNIYLEWKCLFNSIHLAYK